MRKLIMIVLCVLLVATSFVVGCNGSVGLAAPTQEIGHHSTWSTNSGAIRDDYLADYVCNAIPKDDDGVPLVKDVVIMMNSCFSGGFAREFQDVFGIWERTGTKCWGVPWIFASACAADEEAWGYRNGSATELGLGTYWTNALAFQYSWAYVPVDEDGKPIIPEIELGPPGSIRDSNTHNVLADFESARELDWANPEHPYNAECGRREHGVIAYNNGGENIVWNAADTKH